MPIWECTGAIRGHSNVNWHFWDTSQPEHWTIHMPNPPARQSTRAAEEAVDDA